MEGNMEGTPEVHLRHALHHQQATSNGGSTNTASPLEEYLSPANGTNSSSKLDSKDQPGDEYEMTKLVLYQCAVPFLILFCIVSLLINIRILVSVYWIRRPLSPTLHISLSLSGADALTSFLLGLGLTVNSLLYPVLKIHVDACFVLMLEALRLGGVIVTVAHLLALAGNHYLGILKPLHYLSIMTRRNTTVCIVLLWILPMVYIFAHFSLVHQQGFQAEDCVSHFLLQYKFRAIFSSLFFGPFLIMLVIYTHIFVIVRRHQASRLRFSRLSTTSSHSRQFQQQNNASRSTAGLKNQQQQLQFARNVKAIKTTLFILGSYLMGWMPAVSVFLLVCEDCHYSLEASNNALMFAIFSFCNFLIILKTMLNPIIYAARMQEIKAARLRMSSSIRRECCPLLGPASGEDSEGGQSGLSQQQTQRSSQFNSSTRSAGAVLYRLRSCPSKGANPGPPVTTTSPNDSVRVCEEVKLGLLQRCSTRGQRRERAEVTAVL